MHDRNETTTKQIGSILLSYLIISPRAEHDEPTRGCHCRAVYTCGLPSLIAVPGSITDSRLFHNLPFLMTQTCIIKAALYTMKSAKNSETNSIRNTHTSLYASSSRTVTNFVTCISDWEAPSWRVISTHCREVRSRNKLELTPWSL